MPLASSSHLSPTTSSIASQTTTCSSPFSFISVSPSISHLPLALIHDESNLNDTMLPTPSVPRTSTNPSLKMYAQRFLDFVNYSSSPFHAVEACRQRLVDQGFEELKERHSWQLKPNHKYFFTRNASSIVAFAVGGHFRPGQGVSIVAAHTDSPCLKLKPISKIDRVGYLQVGVQCYGGGLWHTWFDRDLSVAGRVMVAEPDGSFSHRLVKVSKPILRIPNLAIHLDRSVNEGFKFNKEIHLTPILATVAQRLNSSLVNPSAVPTSKGTGESSESESESAEPRKGAVKKAPNDGQTIRNHHPEWLQLLADEMQVQVGQIRDFELCLYDTQPSTLGGLYDEFIFSPRLDNLMMSYTSLEALLDSCALPDSDEGSLDNDTHIRLIALFDNEEIGSQSAYGADSALLESTLRRLQSPHTFDLSSLADHDKGLSEGLAFEQSIHHSFLISADMAHAVHPNYVDKHEARHRPLMHHGI
ncbi:hypothetical protein IWQ61_010590, partial [Dispira simplex]